MMTSEINPTELIVIGGSAGSLQVIMELIKNLNENLKVPILIVVHRKAYSTSRLGLTIIPTETKKTAPKRS